MQSIPLENEYQIRVIVRDELFQSSEHLRKIVCEAIEPLDKKVDSLDKKVELVAKVCNETAKTNNKCVELLLDITEILKSSHATKS